MSHSLAAAAQSTVDATAGKLVGAIPSRSESLNRALNHIAETLPGITAGVLGVIPRQSGVPLAPFQPRISSGSDCSNVWPLDSP
jgi:hypothetical protein